MRYFIHFSYDGTNYHGWQSQPHNVTVQEVMEQCLYTFLRTPIELVGAGRTDAGVHARRMVAHFDVQEPIDTTFTTHKLNRLLPPDIAVQRIQEVSPTLHARFDAVSRTYRYYLCTCKEPFGRQYAWRVDCPLNFDLMNQAAATLALYADFTSFSKLHTDVKTNNCRIMHAEWTSVAPTEWVFTIQADRFLRNMVRAIVGTLVEVGREKLSVEGFQRIILQKDRCKAGNSAPACGLFLEEVAYPENCFTL